MAIYPCVLVTNKCFISNRKLNDPQTDGTCHFEEVDKTEMLQIGKRCPCYGDTLPQWRRSLKCEHDAKPLFAHQIAHCSPCTLASPCRADNLAAKENGRHGLRVLMLQSGQLSW